MQQSDFEDVLQSALSRTLQRADFDRQIKDLGLTTEGVQSLLDRQELRAAVAPIIVHLERLQRAQDRYESRAHQPSPGVPPRFSKKTPQRSKSTAAHDRQESQLSHVEDDLVRNLADRYLAPHVRRVLNETRRKYRGGEWATALDGVDLTVQRGQVKEDLFVRTRSLATLGRLLERMPLGSVGVAGARGIGKSTALDHVDRVLPPEHVDERVLFRIDAPAPTEYVPQEFLMHLLGETARAWIKHKAHSSELSVSMRESRRSRAMALSVTAVLPVLLFLVGAWSMASYVTNTGLADPASTTPVIAALLSVLAGGLLGRATGASLQKTWSTLVLQERVSAAVSDEITELTPTRRTAAVVLNTLAVIVLGVTVLLVSHSFLAPGAWSGTELFALSLVLVSVAAMVGSFVVIDVRMLRRPSPIPSMGAVLVGVTAATAGVQGALFLVVADFTLSGQLTLGAALVAAAVCSATLRLGLHLESDEDDSAVPALNLSREALRRVQFVRSTGHSTATGVKLGASSLLPFEASRTGTRSLTDVEVGLTTPELVKTIRDLLAAIHRDLTSEFGEGKKVKVVVAIDELDKLEAGNRARDFLNEIKGVFGVPGVLFLVSVSEDAMAAFEQRGLGFRDAFDSAFDEIVHIPHLAVSETAEVLKSKVDGLMPTPFVALGHCMAGGLPRDLLRAVEQMVEIDAPRSLEAVTSAVVHRELRGKWRAVVSAMRPLPLEPHVTDLIKVLYRVDLCPENRVIDDRCLLRVSAFDEVYQLSIPKPNESELPHLRTLLRLSGEYLGFAYYCLTLSQFFAKPGGLDLHLLEEVINADQHERRSLDYLARARQHLAVNPRLGWEQISYFRRAHGLQPRLEFPDVLLGATGGAPPRPHHRSSRTPERPRRHPARPRGLPQAQRRSVENAVTPDSRGDRS